MVYVTPTEITSYIAVDGTEYVFNDEHQAFLLAMGGEGMPPVNYLVQRGPFQHGVTPLDFRLEPRLIQILHRKNGKDREDYWALRNAIINSLRPNRQTTTMFQTARLRKRLPNGDVRDINVMLDEGLDFAMRDPNRWDEFSIQEVIRFMAFDPTWYDPEEMEIEFSLAGLSNLVFPITFPITFGSTVIDDTQTITYLGNWLSYPTIQIDGPFNGPIISNLTTGEFLELTYNIPEGRTVTIDLAYGAKTVVDDLGNNLIGTLTSDSDIGSFHLAPAPEAVDGENTIRVQGGGAIPGTTQVRLTYFERYIGI